MKQFRISKDLDVVISEPSDTISTIFKYSPKRIIRPLDNERCYIWVNGVYVDEFDKDLFDESFDKIISSCTTIEEVFDAIGYDYSDVKRSIYDFITDDYIIGDYDAKTLRAMTPGELSDVFFASQRYSYTHFGPYVVRSLA